MKKTLLGILLVAMAATARASHPVTGNGEKNYPNDGTTGTAQYHLVKLTSAGAVVTLGTSDTKGAIGIVVGGNGTTGQATVTSLGVALCTFDNGPTAGHAVQMSSTTGGDCHDVGSASFPVNGKQKIGFAIETNASIGIYNVLLIPPEVTSDPSLAGLSTGIVKSNGGSQPTIAVAGDFPTLNQNTSGNAATASALAANGTNCTSTQAAIGVDASGNAEGCWSPASPAGSSGQFQYNLSSALAASNLWQGTNLIEQRNGTNPQEQIIYGTYTDSTHWEGLDVQAGNPHTITSNKGSAGGATRNIQIKAGNATLEVQNAGTATTWSVRDANVVSPNSPIGGTPQTGLTVQPGINTTYWAIVPGNGAGSTGWSSAQLITLSTGGTTTASSAGFVPAHSRILRIDFYVQTTITGSGVTGFTIGPTGATAWNDDTSGTATETGLTAGSVGSLVSPAFGADQAGAANTVTITVVGGTPTAGKIRVILYYIAETLPTS